MGERLQNMTLKEISDYCKTHTCYQCESERTNLRYLCRSAFDHPPARWFGPEAGEEPSHV